MNEGQGVNVYWTLIGKDNDYLFLVECYMK